MVRQPKNGAREREYRPAFARFNCKSHQRRTVHSQSCISVVPWDALRCTHIGYNGEGQRTYPSSPTGLYTYRRRYTITTMDLNVVRLGSLEHDDSSEDGPLSYNSWRYGDEASLYSIAEDSREDCQSSQATDSRTSQQQHQQQQSLPPRNAHPTSPSPLLNTPLSAEDDTEEDAPIEVQWLTADELLLEAAESGGDPQLFFSGSSSRKGGVLSIPSRNQDEGMATSHKLQDEEEEASLGPRHNARRSALFLLLLLCAVLVIVLSLSLALRNNRDYNPPPRVSGGVRDSNPEIPQMDPGKPNEPADPTPPQQEQPTSPTTPVPPVITIDAYDLVWDAIVGCDPNSANDLVNESTRQMEVFTVIVREVEKLITTDERGSQSLDSKVGRDWILEKWALLMLFFATDGEYWDNRSGWYSSTDTCTWYNQAIEAERCLPRQAGGAAVTTLRLGKYKKTKFFVRGFLSYTF